MRVLLVDDGDDKHRRLQGYLSGRSEFGSLTLDKAGSGMEARAALRSRDYDLLVLDILLPWRADGEATNAGSTALIDAIVTDETVRRPDKIVGLTAHADAAVEADPAFQANTWTVLRFDQTSTAWLDALAECLRYMSARAAEPVDYGVDLLVLTALRDPEMTAVHRLPWNWRAEEPLDDASFIRRGQFHSGGEEFSVASAVADRMGMVSSGVLAAKAIIRLRPRYIAMVGICAGIGTETRLGDVVLADPVWDYQSGKRVRDEAGSQVFRVDPHHLPVSHLLKSRVKQLALDRALLAAIKELRDDAPRHELRLLVGPMATGSAVVADGDVVGEIRTQQHRKVIAIEMEAYGVYYAAEHAGLPRPTALALKAVSDFADHEKNDSAQSYAAYTSAAVMRELFERYMIELHPLAGM